ncbi:MAG: dihydrodipicolinate synthase family protein [Caldilineaceae bacterium SB0661_bin_32]|uniref:Dihydrodipicolinate synthase family protein n=1 Tax=Caldilineaceae bacterium SB0661_bin_32 TaxID=2605255 RepID=A0A6B1DBR4_9CHLR|nr:dihydrodipicolinate synthase family protein [Caldilineaceae bacterium SB0661_bin_32]
MRSPIRAYGTNRVACMRSPQELRSLLTGPVMSVHTPFTRDGEIDYGSLRGLVDRGIDAGSTTMLLTYGDSLYSLLTDDEVAEVTRVVAEQTAGRAAVVAADRIWWTGKTVEFGRYAREVGADMLMVLPPDWAGSCTADTFVAHYGAVAAEIPVMVVTNVFSRSHELGLEVLRRLRDEVPGVVAIKDDLVGVFARKMALLLHGHWAIISGGQKQNHFDLIHYGCDGYLSTFVTFAPQVTQAYWQAVQAAQWKEAARIIRDYDMPYFDYVLNVVGGFDAAVHGTYELFGLAQRWRRPPYHSLTDEQMEALSQLFVELKLR